MADRVPSLAQMIRELKGRERVIFWLALLAGLVALFGFGLSIARLASPLLLAAQAMAALFLLFMAGAYLWLSGSANARVAALEQRVADRARALKTGAEISRRLSTILQPSVLVMEVVEQLKSAFKYYHVHIYLFDARHESLVMAGGTGEAGQALLKAGHKIAPSKGLVGRAARTASPVLVRDVYRDPGWLPNPLLPDTRSELACPIAVGGSVVGVLDVQQDQINDLDQDDVELVQLIANQVAVALQNARYYIEVQQELEERRRAEEIIRRDEAQLREATSIASLGYWVLDVFSQVFTVTDEFWRLLHTTAQDQGGYNISISDYLTRFVFPEDVPLILSEIHQAMDTEDPEYNREFEQRNYTAGDALIFLTTHVRIQKDTAGCTARIFGVNQDITARKLAELTLAKRAADLAVVSELSTAVSTIQDPNEMLQTVVDRMKERFNLYHAHIYLLDESGENLVVAKGAGEVGRLMEKEGRSIPLNAEKSLVAYAARARVGVSANDVRLEPEFLPNPFLPGTRSELAAPMIAGDRLLGVLDIQSDAVNRFTEEEIAIQTALASQVAVALQNARSYTGAQKQAEREALINAISERIQSTTSVEEALQVTVREIGRALGAKQVAVRLGLEHRKTDGSGGSGF